MFQDVDFSDGEPLELLHGVIPYIMPLMVQILISPVI